MTVNKIPALKLNGLFNINRLKDSSLRHENIKHIRGLTQTAYQGNHVSICRVLGRYMMFVSNLDERHGVQLQMNGYWEMGVTEILAKLVKPAMNVIDIGANYGYFSFLMAELVKSKGQLYGIGANPFMCDFLNKSIKVNGYKKKIKVINQAISDQIDGLESFSFSNDAPMNGSLTINKSPKALETKFPKRIDIKTNTIDGMELSTKHIDLIKIDIEGSENKFWFGSKVLRKNNPQLIMIMEFNSFRYGDADLFINDIFSSGYSVWGIKSSGVNEFSEETLRQTPTHQHTMLLISKINIEELLS